MLSVTKRSILAVVGGVCMLGFAAPMASAQTGAAQPEKPAHKDKDQGEKHGDKGDHGNKHGDKDKGEKKSEHAGAAKVGEPAPAFELKDTDGKTVKLSDFKGKTVVLEWFNPDCPVVKMHYAAGTMQNVQNKFKDVVWLSINSGAAGKEGSGLERNVQARKDWKMTNPVLLDESGTVGHAYHATNTPHMFVIDGKGTLVYAGAIDDGSPSKVGKTNYVEAALSQVTKGESVATATTKAYGCGVKYGKQGS
jgi:peroxiredoxin